MSPLYKDREGNCYLSMEEAIEADDLLEVKEKLTFFLSDIYKKGMELPLLIDNIAERMNDFRRVFCRRRDDKSDTVDYIGNNNDS
jgi:hypothetical protein